MQSRQRPSPWLFIITAALFVAGVAHAQPGQPPTEATTPPKSADELSARVTAVVQASLPGWTITAPPQVCDRECVARDLPEDAKLTSTYNFLWGLSLRLMPTEPRQQIEARVFCMGEALDAFGMFAHYRSEKTVPGQLATQSFWADSVLHIWRGAFYIRLIPASGDKLLKAAVMATGEAIAAQIPVPEKLPAMMRLMPQGRSLPFTLRYERQGVLGQAALGDGLVDSYLEDGGKLTFALLRAADEKTAPALYDKVVDALGPTAPATPVTDLGKAAVSFDSAQYGLCYAMREGRYVAVAVGVHDRPTAEGLLRITGTNIRVSRF